VHKIYPSILLISHSDSSGGAARAATRIFDCLSGEYESLEFLVAHKSSTNNQVVKISLTKNLIRSIYSRVDYLICRYLDPSNSGWKTCAYFGVLSARILNKSEFDILNMHWIGHGLISLRQIKKIKKPIVFTLHDEWMIDSLAHFGKTKIKIYCGKGSFKFWLVDRSLKLKKEILSKENVFIVTLNSDIRQKIIELYPQSKSRIVTIPNPININNFRPLSKNITLIHPNLTPSKPFLLYLGGFEDKRKGWDLLCEALSVSTANIDLVVVGESEIKKLGFNSQINVFSLEKIIKSDSLCEIYTAAHAVLIPSRDEGLSLVATEALSCGTPIIGFSIQGLKDIVINGKTGLLANAFNIEDLRISIESIAITKKEQFLENCREFAVNNFSNIIVREKYRELFEKVVIDA
jgi:glycosyltransferase involved in cell wall biosynthesis